MVLWDLNGPGLAAVADEVRGRARLDPLTAIVDVGDPEAVRRAAADAGPADVLVDSTSVIGGHV